jgi:uncharacterized protein (TIGR03437 family)
LRSYRMRPRPKLVACLFCLLLTAHLPGFIRWKVSASSRSAAAGMPLMSAFVVNDLGDTRDAAPGNGTCADANSKCTLRAAIEEANALAGDDTISFSVTGTITMSLGELLVGSNVTVSGPGADQVTLSGSGSRILEIQNGPHDVALSGLTITGGRAASGGALSNLSGGTVSIRNCTLTRNTALGGPFIPSTLGGGGVYNAGKLIIANTVISDNVATQQVYTGSGGGIYNIGTLALINSTVSGNGATQFAFAAISSGGGIYNSGMMNVMGGTISGNSATGFSSGRGGSVTGGGIHNSGVLNISGSTISGNRAIGGSGGAGVGGSGGLASGGGIYNVSSGTVTIDLSSISGNSVVGGDGRNAAGTGDGGGIFSEGGLNVTSSLLHNNSARGGGGGSGLNNEFPRDGAVSSGGGISAGGTVNITNSTLSGNSTVGGNGFGVGQGRNGGTGRGGGIFYGGGGTLTIIGSTIIGNSVTGGKAGQGVDGAGMGGGLHVGNVSKAGSTMFAKNTASTGGPDVSGFLNSQGHNLVGNGTGATIAPAAGDQIGTSASQIDPLLGPLVNNGGPTQTHALLPGSPAIDRGKNLSNLSTDQRGAGFRRTSDFIGIPNVAGGDGTDIGAFEAQCSITLSPSPVAPATVAVLPAGVAGSGYSQTITAAGGTAPYSFAVTAGTLPPGLALDSSTGVISGALGTVGTYNFTVTASDATCANSQAYSITAACPAVVLSALPGGTFGAAYGATITALPAGSYAYSVTAGALPPGLTLTPAGLLSGAPTRAGAFNFTVMASGGGGCVGSQAYSFAVAKAATTLAVAAPASVPTYGQAATFTAIVSSPAAGAAPTSAVTFSLDGGAQTFPNVPLVDGKATLMIPLLSAGAHAVSASYAGDANYSASAAPPINLTVSKATLTVKADDATKVYGAALPAFTAGYAGFVNGETAGVLSGSPSLTTSATQSSAAGTYPITAAVGTLGAANYAFTFQHGTLTVTKAASSVTLTSSPNPSIPGQSITLSAAVTSAAGVADGQVEFFRDGTSLGKAALAGGAATLALAGPHTLGSRTFTASYLGSTNFTGSTSASVTHVVSLPCEMSLNQSGRGFTEAGGFATEKVTVSGSCDWQATSNAAWVMVTGYSVSGGTFDYTVAPLTAGVERTGTVTVGSQTFTVFQKKTVAATSGATFIVGDVAAEQFVSAFGAGLASSTATASALPLPTTLGGLEIRVRDSQGAERSAPLFFVSPTQVNYLIPKWTTSGGAAVTFLRDGRVISTSSVTVARLAPGVFSASQTGSGPAAALVQRVNGATVTYEPTARYDPLAARFVALPISFGGANEQVFLLLYGTGLRGVTARDLVTATVGGVPADVTYAGAQGQYEGLDQINLRLTPTLAGKGLVGVQVSVDGKSVNTVQVHLQ